MSSFIQTLSYWLLATRPKTLIAGISPVAIGTVIAFSEGGFHPWAALSALFGCVGIQIGTILANDYFDFMKGADTKDRLGPTRVTQAGLIPPGQVKIGFILAFAMAVLASLYIIYRGGTPILIIGILISFGTLTEIICNSIQYSNLLKKIIITITKLL